MSASAEVFPLETGVICPWLSQASSLELVFDTMTCLFQHLGSRAVPMLSFLGSILHMLTYSLPAILGPVGAGEEEALEDEAAGSSGVDRDVAAEPRSGAQATATYYAAVQVMWIPFLTLMRFAGRG